MNKWAKRILTILGLVVALAVAGYMNRTEIIWRFAMPFVMAPASDFAADTMAALDYSDDALWAALPTRDNDPADALPDGVEKQVSDLAVFFVYPTAGTEGASWNRTIEQEQADATINGFFMPGMASTFSAISDLYAPYYREALFYSFTMHGGENGLSAIDAAYKDVLAAFKNFTENRAPGQPFILAGHSQGSNILYRLLQEAVIGTPLEAKLVAAYLPGMPVPTSGPIAGCTEVDDIGCAKVWNIYVEGASLAPGTQNIPLFIEDAMSTDDHRPFICSPPTADTADGYTAYWPMTGFTVALNSVTCDNDGVLRVALPAQPEFQETQITPGWLHAYEYSLFWTAISKDAAARYDAWTASR